MTKSKIIIGWREWVALPQLGVPAIIAKVDTGARTSALHVDEQWEFNEQGAPWVGFRIHNLQQDTPQIESAAPILDRRCVTDSGGRQTERIFIESRVELGGVHRNIEINLCSRGTMIFAMLLGRTAIRTRFVVDANKSFLHGGTKHHNPVLDL